MATEEWNIFIKACFIWRNFSKHLKCNLKPWQRKKSFTVSKKIAIEINACEFWYMTKLRAKTAFPTYLFNILVAGELNTSKTFGSPVCQFYCEAGQNASTLLDDSLSPKAFFHLLPCTAKTYTLIQFQLLQ